MAARAKKPKPRVSTHPVRILSAREERLALRLRRICMALPDADERISHGEPTWFAGRGKVFAMLDGHHHDSPHLSVWLPQSLDAQEALVASDPACYFKPPYVGGKGWVGVVLDTKPDWDVVAALVRDAYLRVASVTLRRRLEAQGRDA
jgi:predicted DNA-binding protein (MmcQ/YjbR family)